MLSNTTLLDLIRVADTFTHPEINRIVIVFNFTPLPANKTNSVIAKTTDIFRHLKYKSGTPPFTDNIHIDFLQYIVDDFFRKNTSYEKGYTSYQLSGPPINLANAFSENHKELSNGLKRDGYIIVGKEIKKLLPDEIEEAKTESELISKLDKLRFTTSKGHLAQAISNHRQGNWAGANSQFRTFIESLLIDICKNKLPDNKCETAAAAINLLSNTVNPPFFKTELNEIKNSKCDTPFVEGLWKRLHPTGSHPGLSDDEDCTFRYHIAIVFANYLLNRLK